jgi:hypothetical protein
MANRKYEMLADTEALFEKLKKMSMMQLAKELSAQLGVDKQTLAGSIRYKVQRDFTAEMKLRIKKERSFHKNKKKGTTTVTVLVDDTNESDPV